MINKNMDNDVCFLNVNIGSLSKLISLLEQLIVLYGTLLDKTGICETKLNKNSNVNSLFLNGYAGVKNYTLKICQYIHSDQYYF